jgi:hypothetical protein
MRLEDSKLQFLVQMFGIWMILANLRNRDFVKGAGLPSKETNRVVQLVTHNKRTSMMICCATSDGCAARPYPSTGNLLARGGHSTGTSLNRVHERRARFAGSATCYLRFAGRKTSGKGIRIGQSIAHQRTKLQRVELAVETTNRLLQYASSAWSLDHALNATNAGV